MKRILLFTIAMFSLLVCRAEASTSSIVVTADVDNFRWTGEDATNNIKFVLGGIDGRPDDGFFITIEPLDPSKPAAFTQSVLADENYWEPYFRRVTKELAGQEMTAQNNVKQLTVTNVALMAGQFSDYENIKTVTLNNDGDFTIADNMFSDNDHLDDLYVNGNGNVTLGSNIVMNSITFTVHVGSNASAYNAFNDYKTANSAKFIIEATSCINVTADVDNFRWTGEDAIHNIKFVLGGIDGRPDDGFFITIEPLDPSKPAAFTQGMLDDENYWEPYFKRVTKELAGQEMTAQNNVKQLTVTNVALMEGQFSDYDNIKTVTLNYDDDFTIPDNLFSDNSHLKDLYVNSDAKVVLGNNVFMNTIAFKVHVGDNLNAYFAFCDYKDNYNSKFIVDVPTGIEKITNASSSEKIYDLSGRRAVKLGKGVYIVNGKKYFVK